VGGLARSSPSSAYEPTGHDATHIDGQPVSVVAPSAVAPEPSAERSQYRQMVHSSAVGPVQLAHASSHRRHTPLPSGGWK
jgi:hypothetical protein